MDTGNIVTIAGMGLGAIIWALRVESRVNVLTSRYDDLVDRLERIERLIDRRFSQVMSEIGRKQ